MLINSIIYKFNELLYKFGDDIFCEIISFLEFTDLKAIRASSRYVNQIILKRGKHFNTKYSNFWINEDYFNQVVYLTIAGPVKNINYFNKEWELVTIKKKVISEIELDQIFCSQCYSSDKTVIEFNDILLIPHILSYSPQKLVFNGESNEKSFSEITELDVPSLKFYRVSRFKFLEKCLLNITKLTFDNCVIKTEIGGINSVSLKIEFVRCSIEVKIEMESIKELVIKRTVGSRYLYVDWVGKLTVRNSSFPINVKRVNHLNLWDDYLITFSVMFLIKKLEGGLVNETIEVGNIVERCDYLNLKNCRYLFKTHSKFTIHCTFSL